MEFHKPDPVAVATELFIFSGGWAVITLDKISTRARTEERCSGVSLL